MSDNKLFPVRDDVAESAFIDNADYLAMYKRSLNDPDGFWGEHGRRIDWIKPYTKVKDTSFEGDVHIRWFYDGTLNASANCLDRHLARRGDQTAIIWEGDDPNDSRIITYRELHAEVCKLANALKSLGIRKGDVVTIYLPMIPEIAVAVLACARIGAVHSVVFGGFSPDSIAGRIRDCDSNLIITADEGLVLPPERLHRQAINHNVVRLARQLAEGPVHGPCGRHEDVGTVYFANGRRPERNGPCARQDHR